MDKLEEVLSISTHILPHPPHVNFIPGDQKTLNERNLQAASETGSFVIDGLSDTIVPGMGSTEIHFWENAQKFDMTRLVPFMEALLAQ